MIKKNKNNSISFISLILSFTISQATHAVLNDPNITDEESIRLGANPAVGRVNYGPGGVFGTATIVDNELACYHYYAEQKTSIPPSRIGLTAAHIFVHYLDVHRDELSVQLEKEDDTHFITLSLASDLYPSCFTFNIPPSAENLSFEGNFKGKINFQTVTLLKNYIKSYYYLKDRKEGDKKITKLQYYIYTYDIAFFTLEKEFPYALPLFLPTIVPPYIPHAIGIGYGGDAKRRGGHLWGLFGVKISEDSFLNPLTIKTRDLNFSACLSCPFVKPKNLLTGKEDIESKQDRMLPEIAEKVYKLLEASLKKTYPHEQITEDNNYKIYEKISQMTSQCGDSGGPVLIKLKNSQSFIYGIMTAGVFDRNHYEVIKDSAKVEDLYNKTSSIVLSMVDSFLYHNLEELFQTAGGVSGPRFNDLIEQKWKKDKIIESTEENSTRS